MKKFVLTFLFFFALPLIVTSLNIIAPPEMDMPVSDYGTAISWLILFWFPCFALFTYLTHFLISCLRSKRPKFL